MKKFIVIFFILFILVFAGLFGYAVPKGYHMVIHHHLLAENLSKKGIGFESKSIDFHHHKTEFQVEYQSDPVTIEVDSFSTLNPFDNYIIVKLNNLDNQDQFEFKTSMVVKSDGLYFKIDLEDYEKSTEKSHISYKDMVLYIGSFNAQEQVDPNEPNLLDLIPNKSIELQVGEMKIEDTGQSMQMKNVKFKLSNTVEDNLLTIKLDASSSEYNGIVDMKPIFFKDNDVEFSIGQFKFDELKKIDPAQFQNIQSPLLALMPLLKVIHFPVVIDLEGESTVDKKQVEIDLNFKVVDQKLMDVKNNYQLDMMMKNTLQNMSQIFIGFISTTYAKEAALYYSLAEFPGKVRDEKEKLMTQDKIQALVAEDLNAKQGILLEKLTEIGYTKKLGEMYQLNLKYMGGDILINGQKSTIEQMMTMPEKVLRLIYITEEENQLDELLHENGLKLVKKTI